MTTTTPAAGPADAAVRAVDLDDVAAVAEDGAAVLIPVIFCTRGKIDELKAAFAHLGHDAAVSEFPAMGVWAVTTTPTPRLDRREVRAAVSNLANLVGGLYNATDWDDEEAARAQIAETLGVVVEVTVPQIREAAGLEASDPADPGVLPAVLVDALAAAEMRGCEPAAVAAAVEALPGSGV